MGIRAFARMERLAALGLAALLTITCLPLGVETCRAEANGRPTPWWQQAKPESLRRWQAMRFGLFIHWGPVSLKGTEIGWSRGGPRRGRNDTRTGEVPMAEYDNLYKTFNPVSFNAEEWVQIARGAGMKYLVFTSKHHDGFSMFHTRQTDYKITSKDSPYGKDICKQLADACHKHGVALGWYYSPRDWYHPDFATENHARYLQFYLAQLRELCTNYGRVDILWFDGLDSPRNLWGDTPEKSFMMLRMLQPDIVLNNRGGLPGDLDTPEQRIGGFNRARPWETCMTICRQWAWKPNDEMKSLKQCLQTLLYTVGGDGNLLFNVGPMPDGRIEPRQVKRLCEMGDWLERYGDGVYGTRGGPFKPGAWGASTCKDNRIYLYVMNWPEEGSLVLPVVGMTVQGAKSLSGSEATMKRTDDGIAIDVPPAGRDPIATVIELTVEGRAFDITPVALANSHDSLATGKKATASTVFHKNQSYGPAQAVDGDPHTRWATDATTDSAWLEIDLGTPATIWKVVIHEPQEFRRVQAFELQYHDGQAWKTFHEGTTIGPDWSIKVQAVTAQRVRLNILRALGGPTIAELMLF